ncbi:imidazole glycerol phosphate synthase subunit HisF [Striga asiatica]|uniref:Imidazole glycerol phosphate synthase subunit HisF n=1 Tax=Striga asiatica TaxID=4170 RepID=A0A5A7QJY5_STRAF|nr:imidazole glycerol phosphate synthase subunit HisF [Striga asiatica]
MRRKELMHWRLQKFESEIFSRVLLWTYDEHLEFGMTFVVFIHIHRFMLVVVKRLTGCLDLISVRRLNSLEFLEIGVVGLMLRILPRGGAVLNEVGLPELMFINAPHWLALH